MKGWLVYLASLRFRAVAETARLGPRSPQVLRTLPNFRRAILAVFRTDWFGQRWGGQRRGYSEGPGEWDKG